MKRTAAELEYADEVCVGCGRGRAAGGPHECNKRSIGGRQAAQSREDEAYARPPAIGERIEVGYMLLSDDEVIFPRRSGWDRTRASFREAWM